MARRRKKHLAPKEIVMDEFRLMSAMMVYLRDCPYVSSLEGRRGVFVINATDGSRWRVNIRKEGK